METIDVVLIIFGSLSYLFITVVQTIEKIPRHSNILPKLKDMKRNHILNGLAWPIVFIMTMIPTRKTMWKFLKATWKVLKAIFNALVFNNAEGKIPPTTITTPPAPAPESTSTTKMEEPDLCPLCKSELGRFDSGLYYRYFTKKCTNDECNYRCEIAK